MWQFEWKWPKASIKKKTAQNILSENFCCVFVGLSVCMCVGRGGGVGVNNKKSPTTTELQPKNKKTGDKQSSNSKQRYGQIF